MARFFHMHAPHQRVRAERLPHGAAALLLILAFAALAALWMQFPPVESLLPTHPPG
ncbi:MAG: hypothetical protein ACXU82_19545 [Caulobacteraceae bacterium]